MTNEPEIPPRHHLVDGLLASQLSDHLLMLPFAGTPQTAPCIVGIPGPEGTLTMHSIARVLTTKVHPAAADPDDPFQPEGQDVILLIADPVPALQSQNPLLLPPPAV